MKLSNDPAMLPTATGTKLWPMSPKLRVLAAAVAVLAIPPLGRAQTQVMGVGSAIELAREDMRSERNAIIATVMQLSDKDAAAFWPIYRKYEYERSILDDVKAAVVKEYTEKYSNLTDTDAKSMTERMLDYDSRDIALKRKYFKEFSKLLPATTVAKFFQLDHPIDLLMAMKIESSLPPLARPQNSEQQNPEQQNAEQPN